MIPSDERLDMMSIKIAGCVFAQLAPDHRAIVMKLVLMAETSEHLMLIEGYLDQMKNSVEGINDFLRDEDDGLGTLGVDLHNVGRWFEMSKLFDGIPT